MEDKNMKYVVYSRKGQKYEIKKLNSLEEGHEKFNSIGDYDYKELAIDGRRGYTVVRCLYKI